MISEILLNKGVARTGVVIGIVGLAYVSGYYTQPRLEHRIENLKDKISSAIVETITPEEQVRRNMPLYKKELVNSPDKYKKQIVEIACFGITEYPTDVFVKSVKAGIDNLKKYTK
jgi:hypothetical protein